jgi:peptidyl-prolyl cis-trans isomerase B (cyclophilin B)
MFGNRRAEVDKALEGVDFEKNTYQIEFDTTAGKILLDLWPDVAPGHCKNIIGLSKIGFYDGVIFHRVIADFMIQGGCPQGRGTGGPGYTINAEFNNKLHEPGVLSMARTSNPNSAGSQFFLCVARVPHLDRQYTAFGKAADDASLKVIQGIGSTETNAEDRPLKEVKIKTAKVLEKAK